jgi:hypothetical protein
MRVLTTLPPTTLPPSQAYAQQRNARRLAIALIVLTIAGTAIGVWT